MQRGQVHLKSATEDQRALFSALVDELGGDVAMIEPATGRDGAGRRVSVTAHLEPDERARLVARAEYYGIPPTALVRLFVRIGQSLADEIEGEWDRAAAQEA